ncbi:helix-turn-helix transcriptional regulator [Stenotrophomonas sp. SPM]|uniref:helix-turn-helix domain-containing protein n=1 Tax=Stenotrophomonas sp. SPM TaxID=2170735 RepID=UPI0014040D24|nr:helix-turn-helix transcriptional regulator [Stenotrophomonas sp. SPM]
MKTLNREQLLIKVTVKPANQSAGSIGKMYKQDAVAVRHYKPATELKKHWRDKDRRQAYMEASVEQGIAWQIKLNRELRELTQAQLAKLIGTKQSSISRLEDPLYGSQSIPMLTRVANAFDCALVVKLISYSDLASESQKLSEAHQYALPFELEAEKFGGKAVLE